MRDLLESHGIGSPQGLYELNLDVSTEEFLSARRAFTYADLYEMLGNRNTFLWLTPVLWLTPHAAVVHLSEGVVYAWGLLGESRRFYFKVDGKGICALARSPEHLLQICDVVLRLLAASVVHSVILSKWESRDAALTNAPPPPAVAYLMDRCQSLKVVTLKNIELDENGCRVLGIHPRPGVEIELTYCRITDAGASALAVVLGRNQGPTKLDLCYIDNLVLANGLRGNSRLKA
jgi:hypothetical protein